MSCAHMSYPFCFSEIDQPTSLLSRVNCHQSRRRTGVHGAVMDRLIHDHRVATGTHGPVGVLCCGRGRDAARGAAPVRIRPMMAVGVLMMSCKEQWDRRNRDPDGHQWKTDRDPGHSSPVSPVS